METIYAITYHMLARDEKTVILTRTMYTGENTVSGQLNRITDDRNRELVSVTRGNFIPD